MTKKDYIKIADVLRIVKANVDMFEFVADETDREAKKVVKTIYNLTIDRFCNMLSKDNALFDVKRFVAWINK